MGKIVLKNAFVSINGVDLSTSVEEVGITYAAELQDSTTMGGNSRTRLPGLRDWSLDLSFKQDFAAAAVDATLFPLVGADAFAVIVRPDAAAVGPSNPQFSGNGLLESYQPLGNSVGEIAVAPVTIQGDGDLARAVA